MRLSRMLASALLVVGSQSAFSADWRASVGLDYSTGDYGSSIDTDVWALSFGAKLKQDRWTLKASIPWLQIEGPGNVVGTEGVPSGSGGGASRTTESGIGDLVLSAVYEAYYNADAGLGVDVTGKVKLPTADDDKGLGTGKTDYSLQVDPFYGLGKVTLFGTLGRKFYGDPAGTDYNNVWYASLGLTGKLSDKTSAGGAYDFREKVTASSDQRREASLFLIHKLQPQTKLQLYAVRGFSDSSPDWGGGLVLLQSY